IETCRVPFSPVPAMFRTAARVPTLVGLKPTCIVQDCPVVRAVPVQVWLLIGKSPGIGPVTVTDVTVAVGPPEFLTVTVIGEAWAPTTTLGKLAVAGVMVIGSLPVPASATECVPIPGPVMSRLPTRAPMALGVKTTWIVQFAPTASGLPMHV